MARYDTSLDRERGQVRSGMNPMRAGPRGARYGRDFGRYDGDFPSTWQAPAEMRGFRGGSAFSYGMGQGAGPGRARYERPRAPFFVRGGGYDAGLRGERGRGPGYGGAAFPRRGYDARW